MALALDANVFNFRETGRDGLDVVGRWLDGVGGVPFDTKKRDAVLGFAFWLVVTQKPYFLD